MGMAITRSMALSMLMLPSPSRLISVAKPAALAMARNCQLSHSSDAITSGNATRETMRRTSVTMEPLISSRITLPQNRVASQGQ